MARGEIYVKYHNGMVSVPTSARFNYSNGTYTQSNSGQWVDAFLAWGVSMDSTALSALMTPPPLKDMIENKSAIENGKSVIRSGRKYDERTLNLGLNIIAASKSDFLEKYGYFCSQVLGYGQLDISTKYQNGVIYHLDYMSCNQFGEFCLSMGHFVLRVSESNPANRT